MLERGREWDRWDEVWFVLLLWFDLLRYDGLESIGELVCVRDGHFLEYDRETTS